METKIFHFKSAKKYQHLGKYYTYMHIYAVYGLHLTTEGGLVTSFVLFIYQLLSVPKPPSIL